MVGRLVRSVWSHMPSPRHICPYPALRFQAGRIREGEPILDGFPNLAGYVAGELNAVGDVDGNHRFTPCSTDTVSVVRFFNLASYDFTGLGQQLGNSCGAAAINLSTLLSTRCC